MDDFKRFHVMHEKGDGPVERKGKEPSDVNGQGFQSTCAQGMMLA